MSERVAADQDAQSHTIAVHLSMLPSVYGTGFLSVFEFFT